MNEEDKKKTIAGGKIAQLKRELEEAHDKKTEAEEETARLKNSLKKTVLVLVPLLVVFGLHLAFTGHEINHHELRLMLVGKTGAGKSASGNTILGEEAFRVEASPASVTDNCKKKNKVLYGRNITIIDTPGVMDTWLISDQTAHHAHKCVSKSSPEPHVFLLVIRLGRFTVEEKNAVKWIQKNFGEEALKFTMILFTGGDLLEGKPVEKFIDNSYDLQNLVNTCEGRYHVFNNYEQSNRAQVKELFEKINAILHKNMGYFYTKEVHQKVQHKIANEVKEEVHSREREIRQEEELKRKHVEENMKVKERIKIDEIRTEEKIKSEQLINEVKEGAQTECNNREREIRQEEELKRKHLEEEMKVEVRMKIDEIRKEEKMKSEHLVNEAKERSQTECKNRERKIRQEEELKRKRLEEEMKVEERMKMNEMAIKLRDEQYENKNLKAKLEHACSTYFWISVPAVILIIILIFVICSKK